MISARLEMMFRNLCKVYSLSGDHNVSKLDMKEEYVDRYKPMKEINQTNYQHYRWDCSNCS